MSAYPDGAAAPEGGADGRLLNGCLRLLGPLEALARQELGCAPLARLIAQELASFAAPAVALDLQAARLAGALPGETPEERAAGFMRDLGRAERAREFLGENRSLARLLYERRRLGIEAGRELLERLELDRPSLAELLGREPGPLAGVTPLGDAHQGGRRVVRLDFEGGARVVYKPRSMAADRAYAGLLAGLGAAGFEPGFSTLACVAREGYGWQEWAEPAPCGTAQAVERYYRRLGAHLALLHALRGIDFHHENVIACGEQPLLVDLEGLFHPRLGAERAPAVDPLIAETGLDCVLRVGLLPRADVSFGVDVSGLGRDPAARVEHEELTVVGSGGDDVRLGRRSFEVELGANVPRLGQDPVRPYEYVDALAGGFADAHRLVRGLRDELAAFEGAEIRVVLRPTRSYVELLRRQVAEPAPLDDSLAREEVLNALWRGALRRPDLRRAAAAEHHDLWRGEVPRITTRPGEADGYHHALGALSGLLSPHRAPGPDVVERLDDDDLERQLGFLRASVLAAAVHAPAEAVPAPAPVAASGRERFLAAARTVARRLELLALRNEEGRAGWLTAVPLEGHAGRVLKPVGPGLAEGQAGIALFLARLADVTGDAATRQLADAAVQRLIVQLSEGDGDPAGALWAARRIGHAELLDAAAGASDPPGITPPPLSGPFADHSFATGAMGAVAVAHARGKPEAEAVAAGLLAAIERAGLRCAGPGGVEVPGAFTGLAGIGLGWLGLAEPGANPLPELSGPPAPRP